MASILAALLVVASMGWAQLVGNPRASLTDVAACQAALQSTTDPLLLQAKREVPSSLALAFVEPPTGPMVIPRHYLSGSSGPVNPAEAAATRVYGDFEHRVAAGVAKYLATGSHAESACALGQLDAWARAGALLNYSREESSQAWYQVEWTLASAGISESILVNDSTLDPAKQQRVIAWLVSACRRALSFEKTGDTRNNHYYWRALDAVAIGVTASDDALFARGIEVYKEGIGEIDSNGALPKEMARHENAIHYQNFALQPLVTIAQFAFRQGDDLYSYTVHGHTLRDAIVFFGKAVEDPGIVRPYTGDAQNTRFGPGDFAPFAFYKARFGADGLPASILSELRHPVSSPILGNTTLMTGR